LDSTALIEGDESTLAAAQELYGSIAGQAPEEVKADWSVLVRDLESLLQAARGDRAVEDSSYDEFVEAFARIEQDKHDRCPAD
jgi:hypothetical protein